MFVENNSNFTNNRAIFTYLLFGTLIASLSMTTPINNTSQNIKYQVYASPDEEPQTCDITVEVGCTIFPIPSCDITVTVHCPDVPVPFSLIIENQTANIEKAIDSLQSNNTQQALKYLENATNSSRIFSNILQNINITATNSSLLIQSTNTNSSQK
jgi:hypothetical protein